MKKAEFVYKPYLLFLLMITAYYISINVFVLVQGRNMLAILPLTIQFVLVILISIQHRWLRYAVKAFALICIIPSSLRLFGQVMFVLARASDRIDYDVMIKCLLTTAVGVVLFVFCDKSIKIAEERKGTD